jgi:hypothetical protein
MHIIDEHHSAIGCHGSQQQNQRLRKHGGGISPRRNQPASLFRGEIERFPDDVSVAMGKLTRLVPEMFLWLSDRYLEHRSVNGIVEGFERYLATRRLAPTPDPLGPPAIVFVGLHNLWGNFQTLHGFQGLDVGSKLNYLLH